MAANLRGSGSLNFRIRETDRTGLQQGDGVRVVGCFEVGTSRTAVRSVRRKRPAFRALLRFREFLKIASTGVDATGLIRVLQTKTRPLGTADCPNLLPDNGKINPLGWHFAPLRRSIWRLEKVRQSLPDRKTQARGRKVAGTLRRAVRGSAWDLECGVWRGPCVGSPLDCLELDRVETRSAIRRTARRSVPAT